MSTCYRQRPNYVRDWFLSRKAEWKNWIEGKIKEAKAKGLLEIEAGEEFKLKTADKEILKKIGLAGSDGQISYEDPDSVDGKDVDYLAFSSEEEDNGFDKFKGKALGPGAESKVINRHENLPPVKRNVDESKYFNSVLKNQLDEKN